MAGWILRSGGAVVNAENRRKSATFRAILRYRRAAFQPRRDEKQRGQQEHGANRHHQDAQTRVAAVELNPPGEEPKRQQNACSEQRERNRPEITKSGLVPRTERQSEQDVDRPEQRPVRVRQSPHQPACLVRNVEVETDLEAVERLQDQAEAGKYQQPPPAEAQVAMSVVGRFHSL